MESHCLPSLITKFEEGPLDRGIKLDWGGFRSSSRLYISEVVWDTAKLTITNRKPNVGFRLQQESMTLNDLER